MSKKEAKPSIHNADDLIVKMEAEKLGKPAPEVKSEIVPEKEVPPVVEDKKEVVAEEAPADTEVQVETVEEQPVEPESAQLQEESSEDSPGEEVDEYGTKIGKPKLYTEEEVQSMIRKRLRDRHAENPQAQKEVQNAAKDFTPDPESDETWEVQLETFIEKTIQKVNKKQTDAEWRKHEEQTQAEFEIKFTEGMTKYKDFSKVVEGKPITNAMMQATRSMKDPAAFIYAASKQHPKELERIAGIKDAVTQATEIGRLEERMKKARVIPSSPKPAKRISGDTSSEMPQLSIDARIAAHAKDKIMSRR